MADELYVRLACADCGLEFEPKSGKRGRTRIRCKVCSPEQLGQPNRYVPVPKVEGTCAFVGCGARFATGIKSKRFCSRACADKGRPAPTPAQVEAKRVRNAMHSPRDLSPRTCPGCRRVFAPQYGDMRRTFCSDRCRRAYNSRSNSGATHRRRARKYGCRYEYFDKRHVFERDGWRCQICGVDTPKALSGKIRPNAPQLDHVIALSEGGSHTLENTQCVCRACNLRKRAGPPAGQLGLFTSLVNETIKARRKPRPAKPTEPAPVAGFAFLEPA